MGGVGVEKVVKRPAIGRFEEIRASWEHFTHAATANADSCLGRDGILPIGITIDPETWQTPPSYP